MAAFNSCSKEVIPLKQGSWRTALRMRVVAQIIAAIASALAAIHQILKK